MTCKKAAEKMGEIMDALDQMVTDMKETKPEGCDRKIFICLGYKEAVEMAQKALEEKC